MFHRSLFAGSLSFSVGVLRFAKKIPNLSLSLAHCFHASFLSWSKVRVCFLAEKNEKKERKQCVVVVGFWSCSALGNFFFLSDWFRPSVRLSICPGTKVCLLRSDSVCSSVLGVPSRWFDRRRGITAWHSLQLLHRYRFLLSLSYNKEKKMLTFPVSLLLPNPKHQRKWSSSSPTYVRLCPL